MQVRWGAAARLRQFVESSAAGMVRPPDRARALLFGPDPIQVSVTGSGIAVGYGVEFREEALDGRIAALLSEATGRGVAASNRARPGSTLSDQLLEATMAGGFEQEDVLIWCPSLLQMTGTGRPWQWRRQLHQLLQAAPTCRQTIVLELPVAVGDHPIVTPAAAVATRINTALRAAAEGHDRVAVVAVPPMRVTRQAAQVFTAAYYRHAAEPIAAAILAGMNPTAPRCRIGRTLAQPAR